MARSTRPQGLRASRSRAKKVSSVTPPTSARLARLKAMGVSASSANGRGMKPMPKGPPVNPCALRATSWMATAMPKVVMAR